MNLSLKWRGTEQMKRHLNNGQALAPHKTIPEIQDNLFKFYWERLGDKCSTIRLMHRLKRFVSLKVIKKGQQSWFSYSCHMVMIWSLLMGGSGVSIFPKKWVFYKVWYERFEFFLGRPSVVFYKRGVVFFIKRGSFW